MPKPKNASTPGPPSTDRGQRLAQKLERDFAQHRRRESSHRTFLRWLGVLGMVGWPLAVSIVGGAWLGHYLDLRLGTGIQFTLLLLTLGVVAGSLVVWKVLKGNGES